MDDRIELVVPEEKKVGGLSLSILISFVFHAAFLVFIVLTYKPSATTKQNVPIARYVELMRQNPQQFTEAPGAHVDKAPMHAPLSDANRKASMPEPTGDKPTTRPGDGRSIYTPPMPRAGNPAQTQASVPGLTPGATRSEGDTVQPTTQANAAANGPVDWRSAIREVGKVASLGGGGDGGFDLSQAGGGDNGYAEPGELSFETQWYDWGEYAQSMVSRIRVNWYANMPQIIRTGMKGVVTIRFTILHDGRITNVQILEGSGIPPYDYAAKKAIELSSPLNPLPKDFPNPSERVTCMFFYNMQPPQR